MPEGFAPVPVVLEGRHVRVEPLERRHAPGLSAAGADPGIWRWLFVAPPADAPEPERVAWFESWIDDALGERDSGSDVPFAIVRRADERVVGSTRFLTIRREHRGLEIGWTWLAAEAQRTPVNTETKLLLLTHAFETLGAVRVELKTDALNERSRRAMERLGCVFEGVLRHHVIRLDGTMRDSAYYSVLAGEWPEMRARLRAMLERPRPRSQLGE